MKYSRRGQTLIEVLIVVAIIAVVAMITIPHIQQALDDAHRSAVLGNIHTLHTAQAQYYSHYGTWAGSLSELGPSKNGVASAEGAQFIAGDLAMGQIGGYRYAVTSESGGYAIRSEPAKGRGRTYFSDQTMIIREGSGSDPASASSPQVK